MFKVLFLPPPDRFPPKKIEFLNLKGTEKIWGAVLQKATHDYLIFIEISLKINPETSEKRQHKGWQWDG